jgi:hypothetical protein
VEHPQTWPFATELGILAFLGFCILFGGVGILQSGAIQAREISENSLTIVGVSPQFIRAVQQTRSGASIDLEEQDYFRPSATVTDVRTTATPTV